MAKKHATGKPADGAGDTKKKAVRKKTAKKKKTATKKVVMQKVAKKKAAKKKTAKASSQASDVSATPMPERPDKVVYDKPNVFLYSKDHGTKGVLTAAMAKKILGWQEETDKVKFGNAFLFKDAHGRKIRCLNNLTNRPFYGNLATGWMEEILRKKWELNGETIIIDRLGMVHDGQHTLAGLVWAAQEYELRPTIWKEYWGDQEPFIEKFVVVGIDPSDKVVNTIGTGKPRNLADVIFRSDLFSGMGNKMRLKVSRHTAHAITFLWQRTGANLEALAPHSRSHSEHLDFILGHPRILDCVRHVVAEDGGQALSSCLSGGLGYAAGLLYLMASTETDVDEYQSESSEKACDWTAWDTACNFWAQLANGTKDGPLAILNQGLKTIDSTGQLGREQSIGMIVNAWIEYYRGDPVTEDVIRLELAEDDLGRPYLVDHPTVGGIDVGFNSGG